MNCNCIANVRKAFVGIEINHKGKAYVVTHTEFLSAAFMFPNLEQVTNSEIKLTLDNHKPVVKEVTHRYCPFCGTAIESQQLNDELPEGMVKVTDKQIVDKTIDVRAAQKAFFDYKAGMKGKGYTPEATAEKNRLLKASKQLEKELDNLVEQKRVYDEHINKM